MLKRSLIVLATACLAVLGIVSTGNAKTSSSGTFKDGPYTATTPDSSTCGGNWAQDLFVRNFVVHLPPVSGVYTVTEKFQKGHFSTFAGDSAGACDTNPSGHVNEGIQGTFGGTFTMTVTPGTGGFNPGGSCVKTTYDGWDQCDTAGWVKGFFGDGATYDVPYFHFTYNAAGQNLTMHQWVNRDAAHGGNSGDIAN